MTTLTLHPLKPHVLIINDVLLSYPNLFEPTNCAPEGKEPLMKYSAALVFDKDTDISLYNQLIDPIIRNIPKEINIKSDKFSMPIKDGNKRTTIDPFYTDKFYINASAWPNRPPKIVDMDSETELSATDGKILPGCLVAAMISFRYFNHKNMNTGISCSLHAIQYKGKGKPIGIDNESLVKEGGFVKVESTAENFANNVNYIE